MQELQIFVGKLFYIIVILSFCLSSYYLQTLVLHYSRSLPLQVLSQSSINGGRRTGAVDDSGGVRGADRWGRRGNTPAGGQGYELSQDLADKRIEMLERR